MKIAKGTQRPGQTKEQTKLIAQGIQKGIEQYKKQQKAKARELDKNLKKSRKRLTEEHEDTITKVQVEVKHSLLPWVLLILSWVVFGCYFLFIA